jgi:hypothetical protein
MNTLRDGIAYRGISAKACALGLALLLGVAGAATAQDAASASEDELFDAEETVTQAATSSKEAEGKSEFLKYDQVKVGGSITGKLGFSTVWSPAWSGSAELMKPSDYYVSPDLEGKVTLVAKPSTDFGVNMDFRTSWPFTTTTTVANTAGGSESVSENNITVWALYSKFNWNDRLYFSFGKQPLSWGVSKGAFQPADDIFAVTSSIDLTDTGAEREGPISLKTTVPLGVTNNLYFYTGLPTDTSGSSTVELADTRFAVKGEFGFGDTEMALGAYYAYNDHPRLLAMGTTGFGAWNLYGEGVLKYGSERYFISQGGSTAEQESGDFYFTGTIGGYYSDSDAGLTLALAYMYNGEAQKDVSAKEAIDYYYPKHIDEVDRISFGEHYAFASITLSDIDSSKIGTDKLSASLITIADLSDFSGWIMPSLSYKFFDYMSLKLGATFSFGGSGDEYITYGVGSSSSLGATAPGAALNLTLTVGTGDF